MKKLLSVILAIALLLSAFSVFAGQPQNAESSITVFGFSSVIVSSPAPENAYCPFEDVLPKDYYYRAVCWAVENGVISGTSPTRFEPGRSATRADMSVIIWRASRLLGLYS